MAALFMPEGRVKIFLNQGGRALPIGALIGAEAVVAVERLSGARPCEFTAENYRSRSVRHE